MDTLSQIQKKINNLFVVQFKSYSGGLNLSVPLIPRISENYLLNRTVIIGQETNTWYRNNINDGLKEIFMREESNVEEICLIQRYDRFISEEAEYYPGKFWEFNRLLYSENVLKGNMIEDGRLNHCWLNLFTVEACKNKDDEYGRPTKNHLLGTEVMNLQGNLLFEILKILAPNLIISLTGHTLDHFLLSHVLSSNKCELIKLDSHGVLEEKHLCQIKIMDEHHPLKQTRIIRSYHPTYFMGKINTYKKLVNSLNSYRFNTTVADYYTDIFIEGI